MSLLTADLYDEIAEYCGSKNCEHCGMHQPVCENCPLRFCHDSGSPYLAWWRATTPKSRKKKALEVFNKIQAWDLSAFRWEKIQGGSNVKD